MSDIEHVDGRVARGIRTRQAIIEAHTDLVRQGVLKPTAQKIADRAGVSVRTIWTNFADLEALLRATTQRWLDLDADLWEPVSPSLPLDERIVLFCERRAARIEHMEPAARSSVLGEPYSTALQRARRAHVQRLCDDLEHTFGPEIGVRSEHPVVHDELYVAAAWPAWKMWTSDLDLTHDEAVHRMVDAFRRVLQP